VKRDIVAETIERIANGDLADFGVRTFLSMAGSGFVGFDMSDCLAIGIMITLQQHRGAPLSRMIQHFVEAHCTELPPYWGDRGVTNPATPLSQALPDGGAPQADKESGS